MCAKITPPHSHKSVTVKFNTKKAISLSYTAHYYIVHLLPVDICSTMCQQSMIPFVGIIDLFQSESTPGTPLFIHCIERGKVCGVSFTSIVASSLSQARHELHLIPESTCLTSNASFSPNSLILKMNHIL